MMNHQCDSTISPTIEPDGTVALVIADDQASGIVNTTAKSVDEFCRHWVAGDYGNEPVSLDDPLAYKSWLSEAIAHDRTRYELKKLIDERQRGSMLIRLCEWWQTRRMEPERARRCSCRSGI